MSERFAVQIGKIGGHRGFGSFYISYRELSGDLIITEPAI